MCARYHKSHYFTAEIFKWYIFSGHTMAWQKLYCALKLHKYKCRERIALRTKGYKDWMMRIPTQPHQKPSGGTPSQAELSEHPARVLQSQGISAYHTQFNILRSLLLHPTDKPTAQDHSESKTVHHMQQPRGTHQWDCKSPLQTLNESKIDSSHVTEPSAWQLSNFICVLLNDTFDFSDKKLGLFMFIFTDWQRLIYILL